MATQIDVAVNSPDKPVALMLGASVRPSGTSAGLKEQTSLPCMQAEMTVNESQASAKSPRC